MNIRIHARLFASLQKWSPDPSIDLELPAASTVRDAYRHLGVPDSQVAIIMLNGTRKLPESILSDKDQLQLFPFIGGG